MKTVENKTRAPIKIPLPRGKTLRLGPGKTGQIRDDAVEHAALKKLIAAGDIQILEGGEREMGTSGGISVPHEINRGRGKSPLRQRKGDR